MKKNLCLTRNQRKEKLLELENNAPLKWAPLLVMKGLVLEYLSSNLNEKFCYNTFYKQKRKVFTHGSRRKYSNGILEDYKTLMRRKLYPPNKSSIPKESQ